MREITADTVGRHDFLLAPCSPEMFARTYGVEGEHPSCFANLASVGHEHERAGICSPAELSRPLVP